VISFFSKLVWLSGAQNVRFTYLYTYLLHGAESFLRI
jgi:hypothetical protein